MELISKSLVHDGWLKVYIFKYRLEDGTIIEREVVKRNSSDNTSHSVSALVYNTKLKKYVYVKQFRHAINKNLVECVAGVLERDDSPKETIQREILEETGYICDNVKYLGLGYTTPGSFEEKMHMFYVEVSNRKTEGGGCEDENEDIRVLEYSKDEIKNITFEDLKTLYLNTYIK